MIYLEMSPFQILEFEVCVCVGGFFVLVTCKISKDFDAANYEKSIEKALSVYKTCKVLYFDYVLNIVTLHNRRQFVVK